MFNTVHILQLAFYYMLGRLSILIDIGGSDWVIFTDIWYLTTCVYYFSFPFSRRCRYCFQIFTARNSASINFLCPHRRAFLGHGCLATELSSWRESPTVLHTAINDTFIYNGQTVQYFTCLLTSDLSRQMFDNLKGSPLWL